MLTSGIVAQTSLARLTPFFYSPPFKVDGGVWRSPVAHTPGGRGVAGSNPATPTILNFRLQQAICRIDLGAVRAKGLA